MIRTAVVLLITILALTASPPSVDAQIRRPVAQTQPVALLRDGNLGTWVYPNGSNCGALKADYTGKTAVSWSVEADRANTAGELKINASNSITFPRSKTFTLMIFNSQAGVARWFHVRERDCRLSFVSLPASAKQVAPRRTGALLTVANLGTVSVGRSAGTVLVQSTGRNPVEWSVESQSSYTGGEVAAGKVATVTIPRSKSFALTIARPAAGLIGAARCQEQGGLVQCIAVEDTRSVTTSRSTTFWSASNIGTVKSGGTGKLSVTSSGSTVDWSLAWAGSYQAGQVRARSNASVVIPSRKTFVLSLAAPSVTTGLGVIRCRENGGSIVCLNGVP